ncbi:MAG TPA: diol dehydratase reactivase ATPase-like domain-containing protein [Nocardioidaceae bacterium]|nr:diol dehydratase reactivase ATPase-like domain-containing protein [Nocardioidaceae bacterium]
MTVVVGIDVGNATTEVVIGRWTPQGVRHVTAGRTPTRRAKGSPESLRAAAGLVRRLERDHALRADRAFVAPLRPVRTVSGTLSEAPPDTGRLWVAAAGARTVGGTGFGVGRPVLLGEGGNGREPLVVVVPRGTGFAAVAEQLGPLVGAGRVAAVLVEDDEGVLVANRLAGSVPVVDEFDGRPVLAADLVAVEVVPGGRLLRSLTDPLRLADAFGLAEAELADAARVAATLFDTGNAVVALSGVPARDPHEDGVVELADGGPVSFLTGHLRLREAGVGAATGYALPPDRTVTPVDDLWTVDLGVIAEAVQARRAAVRSRPVALAALSASVLDVDPAEELAALLGIPVHTIASEARAARAGALSTPGAGSSSVVVDLGGGTVDAVSRSAAVVAAGAGDLLRASVAILTDATPAAAEWVKRGPAHRVEAPQLLLSEDGGRDFLESPASPDSIGSLVVPGPAGMLAFSRTLAPGEWRALRVRLKVDLVGGNVARALRSLGEEPTTVVVVGGLAGDDELLAAVAGALPPGTAVGRGQVAGELGHRYAVAFGLVRLGTADA